MVLSLFFGGVEVVIISTHMSGQYPFWRSQCRIQIIHIFTQSSLREKDFCWVIAVLIDTVVTDISAERKDDVCNFYCVELMVKQRRRSAGCLTSAPSICLFAHRKQSKIHTHAYNSSLQSLLIISSRVVGMWLFSDLIFYKTFVWNDIITTSYVFSHIRVCVDWSVDFCVSRIIQKTVGWISIVLGRTMDLDILFNSQGIMHGCIIPQHNEDHDLICIVVLVVSCFRSNELKESYHADVQVHTWYNRFTHF